MAKRLSEKQKEEILEKFREGYSINVLAEEFNCTKLTITRNLKKYLSESEFNSVSINSSDDKKKFVKNKKIISKSKFKNHPNQEFLEKKEIDNDNPKLNLDYTKDYDFSPFTEIIPLNEEIENLPRKVKKRIQRHARGEELWNIFQDMDRDGNGVLDKKEFRKGLDSMGLDLSSTENNDLMELQIFCYFVKISSSHLNFMICFCFVSQCC